jgi:soluble lytic murein transglycosylase-like protein
LALVIIPSAEADLYTTQDDGDTVTITNRPTRKQKARAHVLRDRRKFKGRSCFLENRRTSEKSFITSPSRAQIKRSRIIWCEERSHKEDPITASSTQRSTLKTSSQRSSKNTSKNTSKKRQRNDKRTLPKRAESFRGFVEGAAKKYELPEALLWAFMKVESSFIPTAVSRKGALGLMQLMPFTAKDMGVKDAFDPQQNIYGAAKLISILMTRFNGELPLVISAYHAGGGAVTRREGIPYTETSQYMTSVLNAYYRYMKRPPYLRTSKRKSTSSEASSTQVTQ